MKRDYKNAVKPTQKGGTLDEIKQQARLETASRALDLN